MKSIFDPPSHTEVLERLNQLTPESKREWGKMDVGQMLRHCQFPLEIALGKMKLKKPNFFMGLLMKSFKKSLYNDKPWRKNSPTAPTFKVNDERDFHTEKNGLETLIDEFYATQDQKERKPHPAFGHFTYDQWGQMQYKHLDHHLRQFGV